MRGLLYMVGKLSGYKPIKGSQSSYMTGRTSSASKRAQRLDMYHHRSGVYKARQQQNPMGLFGAIRGLISTVGDFFKTLFGGRKKTTSTNTTTTTTTTTTTNNNRDNSTITNPDNNTHTDNRTDTREVDRADDGGGKGGGDDPPTETVPTFASAQVHDKAKERKNNGGKVLTENNPNGNVQFVTGDISNVTPSKDAEGKDDYTHPKSFQVTDSSNGPKNTYTYEKFDESKCTQLSEDKYQYDLGNGKKVTLTKAEYEKAKNQYIMIDCKNADGTSIALQHAECYSIETTTGEDGSISYSLTQDTGDAGAGKTSIDYNKRK